MRYDCNARYTLDQLTALGRQAQAQAVAVTAELPYVWDCLNGGWVNNQRYDWGTNPASR